MDMIADMIEATTMIAGGIVDGSGAAMSVGWIAVGVMRG